MVMARRTPRGPPSLLPEPRGRHPKTAGVSLEVQGYPRGAKQRPLLATTVPITFGLIGAICGGRRRPWERPHQRFKARGGRQKRRQPWAPASAGGGAPAGCAIYPKTIGSGNAQNTDPKRSSISCVPHVS